MIISALSSVTAAFGFTHIQGYRESARPTVSVTHQQAQDIAAAITNETALSVTPLCGGTLQVRHDPGRRGGNRFTETALAWLSASGRQVDLISIERYGNHTELLAKSFKQSDTGLHERRMRPWQHSGTMLSAGIHRLHLTSDHDTLLEMLSRADDTRLWTPHRIGVDLLDMNGPGGGISCWAVDIAYSHIGRPEDTGHLLLTRGDVETLVVPQTLERRRPAQYA